MNAKELVQKYIAAGLITVAPPAPASVRNAQGKFMRTPESLARMSAAQLKVWTPERRARQAEITRRRHAEKKQQQAAA